MSPAQRVVLGFVGAVVAGTALLMSPLAHSADNEVGVLEAAFTAVSAICVTGLTVLDTATAWTPVGQLTILVLIQAGGLGIMFLAAFVGILVGRRLNVSNRLDLGTENRGLQSHNVARSMRNIALSTLVLEAIVALILGARFVIGYGLDLGTAAWYGLFHSVSGFNNAGFALFSDSMMSFSTDPWLTIPLCLAIILGGLGFPVLMELSNNFRKSFAWTMNTNLVLVMTGALLLIGTFGFAIFEWNNPETLGALSNLDKIHVSFFQSVQTRTAGFNSINFADVRPETLLMSDVLMFIGAGPGGTGGGVKITTFAVLLFILLTELRGHTDVNIFGKRLSRAVHREAITIVLVAVATVVAGALVIVRSSGLALDVVLFEAISAFATVGLSTGITASLDPISQITLMVLMLIGRIGPLTLGVALVLRRKQPLYKFPKERPAIG